MTVNLAIDVNTGVELKELTDSKIEIERMELSHIDSIWPRCLQYTNMLNDTTLYETNLNYLNLL